jgi:cell division protein FtsN
MLPDAFLCLRTTVHFTFQDISTEPRAKKAKTQAPKKSASSKSKPGEKEKPLPAADEIWRANLRQKVAEAKASSAAKLCSEAEQRYLLRCGSLGVEPKASTEVCKSC